MEVGGKLHAGGEESLVLLALALAVELLPPPVSYTHLSGGKDSITLLAALARLREFYPKPFTVEA